MSIFNANTPTKEIDTGWKLASRSTNINSDAVVAYRQIGKRVYVRISDCTTKLSLSAAYYDTAKLVGYNLPVPKYISFCAGMVGNAAALFYVVTSGSEAGYLKMFGPTASIASGTSIRAAFSYLID